LQYSYFSKDIALSISPAIIRQEDEFHADTHTYEKTLKLDQRSTNGQNRRGYVLALLGFLRLEQGMYKQALSLYEDAPGFAYHQADQKLIDSILPAIAVVYFSLGDAATALFFLPPSNQQPVFPRETTSQQTAQDSSSVCSCSTSSAMMKRIYACGRSRKWYILV